MRHVTEITLMLFFGASCLWGGLAYGQSEEMKAQRYFEQALKEKEAAKKIAMLEKTIHADPEFVAALINLALVYRNKKDYQKAELYLNRARPIARERSSSTVQYRVLFNLAKIHAQVGNANLALQLFHQARNLEVDKSMLSYTRFESGRILYNQGKYPKAITELKAGRAYNAGNRARFDNMIFLAKAAQKVRQKHEMAEMKMSAGDLAAARTLYQEIEKIDPSFKNAAARIAEIDSLLSTQIKPGQTIASDNQSREIIEADDRPKAEGSVAERTKPTDAPPQSPTAGETQGAKDAVAVSKQGSLSGQEASDAETVKKDAGEGEQTNDSKRAELLSGEDGPEPLFINEETAAVKKPALPELDSLYRQALFFQDDGQWARSIAILEKITAIEADFRDVNDLLVLAKSASGSDSVRSAEESRPNFLTPDFWMPGGNLIVGLSVSILFLAFFFPMARAKFYTMRGKYLAAAVIYERAIERNPGKLKLYPALAELYLLNRRTDNEAMKIYKTVLKLKLETRRFKEINSIVTNAYLSTGRPDNDAILVLEDALKKEMGERGHRRQP